MWRMPSKIVLDYERDAVFTDLCDECAYSKPGARLTQSIRTRLEKLTPEKRRETSSRIKIGASPFFTACRRGQVEIVEYLLSVCNPDIERRGLYEVLDERSVHYVTPLWGAVVAGHLNTVKLLLRYGADINAVSDTGSTPVRSACFMTHLEIVQCLIESGADINRPNYNGGTCLINSVQSVDLCTFLLKNGADVNAKDIQNKTALHYAIQEHRLETTQLLIENGADHNSKSRYGDDALQTACLKGSTIIYEYLTKTLSYSNERIANAHELLGSTALDEHNDLYSAWHHWSIAILLRESEHGLLPKTPIMPERAAFGNQREFASTEELENLMTDLDAIRIQSLLITERILGPFHKDTVFRLMYRGASYIDLMRFQRCVNLWRRVLEIRIERDSILYSDTCFMAQALVRLMLDFNEKLKIYDIEHDEDQRFEDLVAVFKMLTENIVEARRLCTVRPTHKRQVDSYDRVLRCITHLIYLLLETAKTKEKEDVVSKLITDLIRVNPTSLFQGDSLLHLCVSKINTLRGSSQFMDEEPPTVFPDERILLLLLDHGAQVNARNTLHSTPLHAAALSYNYTPWTIKLLLDHGAHVDQPNLRGECPTEKMKLQPKSIRINVLNYITLKCLCSTVINKYSILYEDQVPQTLANFIQLHKP